MCKVFFDTNILLYGYDSRFLKKQYIALTLLEHAGEEQNGCMSTQVLQEFYTIATKKLALPSAEVREMVCFFPSGNWRLSLLKTFSKR